VLVRHAALTAGAVLVLGLGVYLFREVRARPAAAQVKPSERPAVPRESEHPARVAEDADRASPRGAGAPREDAPPPVPEERPTERPPPTSRQSISAGFRERPQPEGTPPDKQPYKIAEVMDEANKAYDRGDLDDARALAQKVLAAAPNNIRMLRLVVSASCIAGDAAEAQKSYLMLPKLDREQMKTRCGRYGVTFPD
jgi:hypothetical protein